MPRPKDDFEVLHPCDFYTPAELLDPNQLYTVYEIARLLQGLEPDAQIDEGTEEILLDWAIPWVMFHSTDMVVAEPPTEEEPGYYGLKVDGDVHSGEPDEDVAPAETGTGTDPDTDIE